MQSKILDFLPEAVIEFSYNHLGGINAVSENSSVEALESKLSKLELEKVNPAALKLLGAGSVSDLKQNGYKLANKDLFSEFKSLLANLKREKPILDLNLTFNNLKHQKKYIQASCALLSDKSDSSTIMIILKDLTRRIKMENKVETCCQRLKQNYKGILHTFYNMVRTKDPYTAAHQEKVAGLCRTIAREMKLDEKISQGLYQAAIVHDIGKINIPSSILSKPGRLSDIERRMINTHSRKGYEMLQNINFPWPLAKIVLQHHERMDGSGYPQGLTGRQIMIEARILAVADVVEAMSSHRPYRPSLGINRALEEISEYQGKLYDVSVVETCIHLFRNKDYKF